MSVWDNYECDGQMSLNDWLSDRDKVREVGIIGLCDDPICSNCGYEFRMVTLRDVGRTAQDSNTIMQERSWEILINCECESSHKRRKSWIPEELMKIIRL